MDEKEHSQLASQVFDFLYTASRQELIDLGFRLGEKADSLDPYIKFIVPLCHGIRNGTTWDVPFEIPELDD